MTQNTEFTLPQIMMFREYEDVRSSGAFNMFNPRARHATGMSEEEYLFVMKNYSALRSAAAALDEE